MQRTMKKPGEEGMDLSKERRLKKKNSDEEVTAEEPKRWAFMERTPILKKFEEPFTESELFRFKLMKSGFLFVAWILLGLTSIINTALPDLMVNMEVNVEEIARGLSSQGLGGMIGCLAAGLYSDITGFSNEFNFAVVLMGFGVSCAMKAIVTNLGVFGTFMTIEGFCASAMNVIGCHILVMLWAEKVDVPMHLLHVGFGIGWTFAPSLVIGFMSHPVEVPGFENSTHTNGSLHHNDSVFTHNSLQQEMKLVLNELDLDPNRVIAVPFFIVGGLLCVLGGVFLVLHFKGQPSNLITAAKPRSSITEIINPGSCAGGDKCFGITMTAMFAGFYMLHVAQQLSVTRFLYTYAVETVKLFSEEEGVWLMMVNGLCFTMGRLIMALVAFCVPIQLVVFFELTVMLASSIALAAGPVRSKMNIWICSCIFNAASGPLWPAGFTWASKSLVLYTFVIALIELGNQTGGLFFQWLAGYLLQYCSDQSIMYFTVIMSAMILILGVAIHVVTITRKNIIYKAAEEEKKPISFPDTKSLSDEEQ